MVFAHLQRVPVPARARLAAEVAESRCALVVLSGASGQGKSTVLQSVAEHPDSGLSVPPDELRLSNDLQQILLRQVGALLRAIADDENVEQMAHRLLDAIASVAVGATRELVATVALRVFDVATGGLGPRLVARLKPLREEFVSRGAGAAADDLAEFLQPDPLEVLLGFLQVAVDFSDTPVTLRVDEAQKVDERGQRLLADLATALPDRARIIVAWRTETGDERDRLARLVEWAPLLELHELRPLDYAELAEWLRAAQAVELGAEDVLALTNGSPLIVADALRRGLPSSADRPLAELVGRAVGSLSKEATSALTNIAVLPRRPPTQQLAALVGFPSDALRAVETELIDAGLLSGAGEGGPWLHELRREAVIDLVLDGGSRARASRTAADILGPLAAADDTWQIDLLSLVRAARPTYPEAALELGLLDLPWNQVALLAAHLELMSGNSRSVRPDPMLRYARDVWIARGDLIAALESLVRGGLLTLSGEAPSIRVQRDAWPPAGTALLCARCLEHLGRRPIPDLAGSVVRFGLSHQLGAAEGHFTRVGNTDPHALVRLAHAVLPGEARHNPTPTLLAAVHFRDVPMPLVAWYADRDERDRAAHELNGFTQPLFGKRLQVSDVTTLPTRPAPTERLLRALEVAFGVGSGEIDDVREAPATVPIEEVMQRRLRTFELLWELASAQERAAMELDERIALAWMIQDDWFWEAEVHGGRRGVHRLDVAVPARSGAFTSFRLVEALALTPFEQVLGPHGQSPPPGRDLPEIEVMEQALERAAGYNGTLPPLPVPTRSDTLAGLLREALHREQSTATELQARLPLPSSRGALSQRELTVLLPADRSAHGMWVRDEPWCVYAWRRSEHVDAQVRTIAGLRDDLNDVDRYRHALEQHAVRLDSAVSSFGIANAASFLAEVLGYRETDVRLVLP